MVRYVDRQSRERSIKKESMEFDEDIKYGFLIHSTFSENFIFLLNAVNGCIKAERI